MLFITTCEIIACLGRLGERVSTSDQQLIYHLRVLLSHDLVSGPREKWASTLLPYTGYSIPYAGMVRALVFGFKKDSETQTSGLTFRPRFGSGF